MTTVTKGWQVYTVPRTRKGRASIPEAPMITVPESYSFGATTLPWTVTTGQKTTTPAKARVRLVHVGVPQSGRNKRQLGRS